MSKLLYVTALQREGKKHRRIAILKMVKGLIC